MQINRIDEGLEEGDIVRVMTHDNRFIAVGHFQIGSIAVRVLSFHDVKIDDEFWESRLSAALQVRNAIGVIRQSGDAKEGYPNTTYRLVHGEGDNLPGLVIDYMAQQLLCRLIPSECTSVVKSLLVHW